METVEEVVENRTVKFFIIKVGNLYVSGVNNERSFTLHDSPSQAREFDVRAKGDREKFNSAINKIEGAEAFEVTYHTIKTKSTRKIEGVEFNESR